MLCDLVQNLWLTSYLEILEIKKTKTKKWYQVWIVNKMIGFTFLDHLFNRKLFLLFFFFLTGLLWWIDFIDMSTHLVSFYGLKLGNHMHGAFIFTFFILFKRGFFVCFVFVWRGWGHMVIWYQVFIFHTNNFHSVELIQVTNYNNS